MIDLDALERMTDLDAPPINGDELFLLVAIARAVVAWRDSEANKSRFYSPEERVLLEALRDAGL